MTTDDEYEQGSINSDELNVLNFWNENNIFSKSIHQSRSGRIFKIYDGPPFANGTPHYGHILAGTIKDIIPRYKTMMGFYVPRRFGWDCHGLPVENEVEKNIQCDSCDPTEKIGIEKFNELCRAVVSKTTSDWSLMVSRMGRWIDMDNCWKTMDISFMESVWWVFAQIYKKGLVYEGYKVMPFSWKLGTPLSNFEASQNYKQVCDESIYVKFKVVNQDCYFVAWTTTPWTLPSNLALAVNPSLNYVLVRTSAGRFWIGANAAKILFPDGFCIEREVMGSELVGIKYEPLFDYFVDHQETTFKVLSSDSVSDADGTSVVHMAPAFGEVDFDVCKKHGISPVCPINNFGFFTSQVPLLDGKHWSDASKIVVSMLSDSNRVLKRVVIEHRYPFCWRTDTPLIYKATKTWFVSVESIKQDLINNNKQIHWIPEHIKDRRFGKWLDSARDWAVSRNRFWGTPIPVWRSEDGRECIAVESRQQLYELSGIMATDLHKEHVDRITFRIKGMLFERIPEVFDCWFESGAMPFGHVHYPFASDCGTDIIPADFIAEGLDQTRGWFYTLNVISTAIENKPAFKNVIVNGTVLAEDGNKMSKRLKNYPDANELISKYGADAIRLYLTRSPAMKAENLSFSESGVEWVVKQVIMPLKSCVTFFEKHCKNVEAGPDPSPFDDRVFVLEKWILSRLAATVRDIQNAFETYHIYEAPLALEKFVEELTNWYIRRSRKRFWNVGDYKKHFCVFRYVLKTLSKAIAPIAPFIAEYVFSRVKNEFDKESVHLESFPVVDERYISDELEHGMNFIRESAAVGHSLRKEHKIRVRQPLRKVLVASNKFSTFLLMHGSILCEELNCLSLEVCEDAFFISKKAKPNFKELGRRIPALVKQVKPLIELMNKDQIDQFMEYGKIVLDGIEILDNEITVDLVPQDGVAAAFGHGFSVMLDTALDGQLISDGIVREFISKSNALKRRLKIDPVCKLKAYVYGERVPLDSIFKNADYICEVCHLLSIDESPTDCEAIGEIDALDGELQFSVVLCR